MKKSAVIGLRLSLLALLLAWSPDVSAICGNAHLFGANSYIYTPGLTPGFPGGPGSSMNVTASGAFWAIGSGDPAIGRGNDNGTWPAVEGYNGYYYYGFLDVTYLYGYPAAIPIDGRRTWAADQRIEGCIDVFGSLPCMAVLLADQVSGVGYFVYMTDLADQFANYEFAPGASAINLAQIPTVAINGLTRVNGTQVDAEVAIDLTQDELNGFFVDLTCGVGAPVAYKVRQQNVPRGTTPPPDREIGGSWVDISGPIPATDPVTVSVGCTGDQDAFLAVSLVFDSGFETAIVSADSEPIACGSCSGTDNDGDGFCTEPEGDRPLDCDDANSQVFPLAPQLCDGLNNDCENPLWPVVPTDDADLDADGVAECAGDCDDTDPLVSPNAPELCNGQDDDCDGQIDEGSAEVYDGQDNDCDGQIDEGLDDDGDGIPNFRDLCPDTNTMAGVGPDGCGRCRFGRGGRREERQPPPTSDTGGISSPSPNR